MSNFINLNLSSFFNHKLIGEDNLLKNVIPLSNSGIGGFFFNPCSLPDSLEIISIDGIPYIFPDKSPDKYDNITCEEQKIIVPSGKYSTAYILGLCEWGDFSEKIKLQFDDNTSEEIEVFFLDWWKAKWSWKYDINKDCEVALKASISNSSIHYIYYNKCNIFNSDKILNSIELPYNPNMHIFGITLKYSTTLPDQL